MIETLFEILDRGVTFEVNAKINVNLQKRGVKHLAKCDYCSWSGTYSHKKSAERAQKAHQEKCEYRAAANGWIANMQRDADDTC